MAGTGEQGYRSMTTPLGAMRSRSWFTRPTPQRKSPHVCDGLPGCHRRPRPVVRAGKKMARGDRFPDPVVSITLIKCVAPLFPRMGAGAGISPTRAELMRLACDSLPAVVLARVGRGVLICLTCKLPTTGDAP